MYNTVRARDGRRQVKSQLDFKKFLNFFKVLGHYRAVVNRLLTIVCAIVERARCKLFNRQNYQVERVASNGFRVSLRERGRAPDWVLPELGKPERFFQSKV